MNQTTFRRTAFSMLVAFALSQWGLAGRASTAQCEGCSLAVQPRLPAGVANRTQIGSDVNLALNSEDWLVLIDLALVKLRESKGTYLIAVARLGKGEKDPRLNQRRLNGVQELMKSRGTPVRLVAATGERVPELGRVELYVSNERFAVLPYLRNRAVPPYDTDDPNARP